MSLIQDYLALVTSIVSVHELKDTSFIKLREDHNRKVTQMRTIAMKIEQNHPQLKGEFCELLSHEKRGIRLWVAHHILEVMNCEQSHRRLALREIRYHSRTDKTANGFGEKVWLKDWYKSHPKDRWLR